MDSPIMAGYAGLGGPRLRLVSMKSSAMASRRNVKLIRRIGHSTRNRDRDNFAREVHADPSLARLRELRVRHPLHQETRNPLHYKRIPSWLNPPSSDRSASAMPNW